LNIQILFPFDPGVAQHTGGEPAGRRGKKAAGLKRPLGEQAMKGARD